MNRRIALNLTFFAAIGVGLMYWAVGNVLQIDLVDKPYTISADFETSPGLQPGFDVGYLGTPIGRVRRVELADGHVSVVLSIEKGREIPEGSSLAVRRKSAIGEPYVDVVPPADVSPDGPFLEADAHIPMARTSTPLPYAELFDALNDLISAVPENDLDTVLHELAIGLDGRSESLRRLITGSSDALGTFADHSDLIEQFTANMADLVGTLAEHRVALGQGLDNAAEVTDTLSDANADLTRVLTDGNSLATRTADLLAASKPDVSCILGGLGDVIVRLGRPDMLSAIQELLATGPAADNVFDDVVAHEADGPYIRAIPPLNIGGEDPVPVYPSPHVLPDVPDVPACPDLAPVSGPSGAAVAVSGDGSGAVTGASPAVDPGSDHPTAAEAASSRQQHDSNPFNPFVLVAALLALAALMAVRPWRWLPGRGNDT